MSDAVVNRLAMNAWCAAAARLTTATAVHSYFAYPAKSTGSTQSALISMGVRRARVVETPRRTRNAGIHPPATLPISEIKYTVINGGPMWMRFT